MNFDNNNGKFGNPNHYSNGESERTKNCSNNTVSWTVPSLAFKKRNSFQSNWSQIQWGDKGSQRQPERRQNNQDQWLQAQRMQQQAEQMEQNSLERNNATTNFGQQWQKDQSQTKEWSFYDWEGHDRETMEAGFRENNQFNIVCKNCSVCTGKRRMTNNMWQYTF